MGKINHLSLAKVNYRNCINSLADGDFNKALEWIDSAMLHLTLYRDTTKSIEVKPEELDAKIREYNKLKLRIEIGSKKVSHVGEQSASGRKDRQNLLTFEDVVGLSHVKETIQRAIVYPFKYQEIYRAFKRRSGGGILLYGPPGTGKTMIAKAVAGEIDAEFISVNCSDVYSKWHGESQQNIKKIFERARKASRAVIFFDEFDALGHDRTGDETDNSSNGVVCELLAQLDGFCTDPNSTVLVIAATNRPWNIDSALLRSGRFERHLYVGMPDEAARAEIIQKQMSELPVEELCYESLGASTNGYSSADVAAVCEQVKDRAIMRSIAENCISKITQEDFTAALSEMHSTVDVAELKRLESFI